MSNTNESKSDLVVLGGGSGGYAAALRASQLGMRVTLVEEDEIGGTCLHRGCIPTKAMLHAAEVADAARHAAQVGIKAAFEGVDASALGKYRDGVVQRLHRGLEGLVAAAGVEVVRGCGVLTDSHTVQVGGNQLRGDHIILATGAEPRLLPGVELGDRVVTSAGALRLDYVPKSVVVIGGSVIGVELASAWRSFGSEVTVVEALPSLVPQEEPVLARTLDRALRKRGVQVRAGIGVAGVRATADDVTVELADGDRITADLVLVAIGRVPRSHGIGLDEIGVTTDRGWVVVDERLCSSVPGIRAVGDLVPGPQLAHRGFAHGIFVAEDIAGLEPVPVVDGDIPRIVYSDPELASVGLTEAQAVEVHGDGSIETVEYDLGGNGRSQILQTSGTVKVVRRAGGPIVGVHMVGARIGEQIGEAAAWVAWDAHPEDIADHVHAHPTQNEALGEAAMVLAGKPLHVHG